MAHFRGVLLLLVVSVVSLASARVLQKRSFVQLGCMGDFDRSIFARLDAVCEECYELYKEPDIHTLCRSNCFNNNYFRKCVKALLYEDEEEDLERKVKMIYGKRR